MDEVIQHVALPHEHDDILREEHNGIDNDHFSANIISKKVLQVGIWYPTLQCDAHFYAKSFDIYERID